MIADNPPANRGNATFASSLYRGVTTVGLPLVELLLQRRLMRGKEEPSRIDERRGIPGGKGPQPLGP